MALTDKELKTQHGLSRPQFDALRRSVEYDARFGQTCESNPIPRVHHARHGLSFGAAPSTIRVLSNGGYISLELVHAPDEIVLLNTHIRCAIESARTLLAEGNWKSALSALTTACKLDSAVEARRWKLTEKALGVVALNQWDYEQ